MRKKLIEYMGEIHGCDFANVDDFLRDIKDNSTVTQFKQVVDVLVYIENQENVEARMDELLASLTNYEREVLAAKLSGSE